MAALRNLAIAAIRLTGQRDITEATAQQAATCTAPSKSSNSSHDLETTVGSNLLAIDGFCDCCAAVADQSGDVFQCDSGCGQQ